MKKQSRMKWFEQKKMPVPASVLALLLTAALCLAGCSQKEQPAETETETAQGQSAETETETAQGQPAETETETAQEQPAETETETAQETVPESLWDSVQEANEAEAVTVEGYTYRPERRVKIWYTPDNREACKVTLELPVWEEGASETDAINAFYEEWALDKIEEYEPVGQEAVAWMSQDENGDVPPYGDEVSISNVTVLDRVIGILHESYLFTGGAHGMPGRENHLFDRQDGKEVALWEVASLSEEEINELVRSRFLALVESDTQGGFFEDAAETLEAKTDYAACSYLSGEGVVFYTLPYEIAPYAAGYTEITVPYSELGM